MIESSKEDWPFNLDDIENKFERATLLNQAT